MNFWPIISAKKKESSFFAVTLDQLHSSAAGEWFPPGWQNVDGKKPEADDLEKYLENRSSFGE